MKVGVHTLYFESEEGRTTDKLLAHVHPASPTAVELVVKQDENMEEGRSEWVWVRLQNGDLILGVFPQGGTYEACEQDAAWPGRDRR